MERTAAAPVPAPSQKRSMNLELLGQKLTVLSDNDDTRVRDLVDFVNRKLEEAKDSAKRAQPDQVALLALLNVAEELFREKQTNAALKRRVRERSVKLLGAIDEVARAVDARDELLRTDVLLQGTLGELDAAKDGG